MQPTTLKELGWIHDCALLSILYDTSSDAGQSIRLTMRCPTDLGYAPWEGKNLVLAAIDVAMSKHVVCGVAGPETIDAVRPGISAAVRESTMEARRMGVRFPSLEFTISLHSGSALEVICQELQVEVGS
jgi:hypothetical protein